MNESTDSSLATLFLRAQVCGPVGGCLDISNRGFGAFLPLHRITDPYDHYAS